MPADSKGDNLRSDARAGLVTAVAAVPDGLAAAARCARGHLAPAGAYADDLADTGRRLYLSGVDERTSGQLLRACKLDLNKNVYLIGAHEIRGESTEEAWESANEWLGNARTDPPRIKTS